MGRMRLFFLLFLLVNLNGISVFGRPSSTILRLANNQGAGLSFTTNTLSTGGRARTVSGWFWLDSSLYLSNQNNQILSFGNSNNVCDNTIFNSFVSASGQYTIELCYGGKPSFYPSNQPVSFSNWNYLAYTFDGYIPGSISVYVNSATGTVYSNLPQLNTQVGQALLGGSSLSSNSNSLLFVDNLRMWNTLLQSSDIATDMMDDQGSSLFSFINNLVLQFPMTSTNVNGVITLNDLQTNNPSNTATLTTATASPVAASITSLVVIDPTNSIYVYAGTSSNNINVQVSSTPSSSFTLTITSPSTDLSFNPSTLTFSSTSSLLQSFQVNTVGQANGVRKIVYSLSSPGGGLAPAALATTSDTITITPATIAPSVSGYTNLPYGYSGSLTPTTGQQAFVDANSNGVAITPFAISQSGVVQSFSLFIANSISASSKLNLLTFRPVNGGAASIGGSYTVSGLYSIPLTAYVGQSNFLIPVTTLTTAQQWPVSAGDLIGFQWLNARTTTNTGGFAGFFLYPTTNPTSLPQSKYTYGYSTTTLLTVGSSVVGNPSSTTPSPGVVTNPFTYGNSDYLVSVTVKTPTYAPTSLAPTITPTTIPPSPTVPLNSPSFSVYVQLPVSWSSPQGYAYVSTSLGDSPLLGSFPGQSAVSNGAPWYQLPVIKSNTATIYIIISAVDANNNNNYIQTGVSGLVCTGTGASNSNTVCYFSNCNSNGCDPATSIDPRTITTNMPTTNSPTVTPSTALPTTPTPSTATPSTPSPSTPSPSTSSPSTPVATTLLPSTTTATTVNPTTQTPTVIATTLPPSTIAPSSSSPSTGLPSTSTPSTLIPSSLPPTTAGPTSSNPTSSTSKPSTASVSPTTSVPSTAIPSTQPSNSPSPTSLPPTSTVPTSTSPSPSSTPVTTSIPTTNNPNSPTTPAGTAAPTPSTATTGQGPSQQSIPLSTVQAASTSTNCFLLINGNVYDVTAYLAKNTHPGGNSVILTNCGKDSSSLYNGQSGHVASNLPVNTLLKGPLTGATLPVVSLSQFALHNTPSDCWINIFGEVYDATAFVSGNSQAGAHPGGSLVLLPYCGQQDASLVFEVAEASHQPTEIAMNVVWLGPLATSSSPVQAGISAATVATQYNTASKCWIVINGNVYNPSAYLSSHPGGASEITSLCGSDATQKYNAQSGHIPANLPQKTALVGPLIFPSTGYAFTAPVGISASTVAAHNSGSSCYVIFFNQVYDASWFINSANTNLHPGGVAPFLPYCGADGTNAFIAQSGHQFDMIAANIVWLGPLLPTNPTTSPPPNPTTSSSSPSSNPSTSLPPVSSNPTSLTSSPSSGSVSPSSPSVSPSPTTSSVSTPAPTTQPGDVLIIFIFVLPSGSNADSRWETTILTAIQQILGLADTNSLYVYSLSLGPPISITIGIRSTLVLPTSASNKNNGNNGNGAAKSILLQAGSDPNSQLRTVLPSMTGAVDPSASNSSGGVSSGTIAGIVIGVILGIILISVIVFLIVRQMQKNKTKSTMNSMEMNKV